MEGKLKILRTNKESKETVHISLIFCAFGTFIVMSLRGKVYVWLGCTKTRSPGIGTVLH